MVSYGPGRTSPELNRGKQIGLREGTASDWTGPSYGGKEPAHLNRELCPHRLPTFQIQTEKWEVEDKENKKTLNQSEKQPYCI